MIAKLEKDIITIPREIENDVADAVDIIKHFQENVQKCGSDAINKFEASGKKLVAKMTLCVYNKIDN